MIAMIIIVAVVAGAIAVITAATRTRPPGRHATDGDAERASMAKLRGQPADRFTPGVVLPRTPQLGEPLKELPERPRPGTTCDRRDLGPAGVADVPVTDAGPGTLFADVADEIDALIDEVRQRFNPRPGDKPRPAHATDGQTTGEIFEHLCEGPGCWCQPWTPTPDAPPAEIVEGLNGHYTVDALIESMYTRAQADELRRALGNGQVSSDA